MKEKFKWDVKMYIVLSEKKMFKISMVDNMKLPLFPEFTNKINK